MPHGATTALPQHYGIAASATDSHQPTLGDLPDPGLLEHDETAGRIAQAESDGASTPVQQVPVLELRLRDEPDFFCPQGPLIGDGTADTFVKSLFRLSRRCGGGGRALGIYKRLVFSVARRSAVIFLKHWVTEKMPKHRSPKFGLKISLCRISLQVLPASRRPPRCSKSVDSQKPVFFLGRAS